MQTIKDFQDVRNQVIDQCGIQSHGEPWLYSARKLQIINEAMMLEVEKKYQLALSKYLEQIDK